LPDMFCHEREGGEYLHQYLHDYLSHGRCRRDLSVNVETLRKVFYRLEQIHESIQVDTDAVESLRYSDVTKIRT
jgi:hypothetical protein